MVIGLDPPPNKGKHLYEKAQKYQQCWIGNESNFSNEVMSEVEHFRSSINMR